MSRGTPADRGISFAALSLTVVAFAVAMACVEAAVVVDLRAALDIGEQVVRLAEVPGDGYLLAIEVGRELATLVMLAAVGVLAGRTGLERLAWAAVAFGTWDILYYAWLRIMIGWPSGLDTPDVLFLVPSPWVGPVWAPILVSIALVGFGLAAAARLRRGGALPVTRRDVAVAGVGGVVVIASFVLTAASVVEDADPAFWWPLFALGLGMAVTTGIVVLRRPSHGGAGPPADDTG